MNQPIGDLLTGLQPARPRLLALEFHDGNGSDFERGVWDQPAIANGPIEHRAQERKVAVAGDEVVLEQAGEPHQHQADRAVAADEILRAAPERRVDHVPVHRIEDDRRVVLHAQRAGSVDPVPAKPGSADLRIHRLRPITALARHDRVEIAKRGGIVRILQRAGLPSDRRAGAACARRRKERRVDQVEVPLVLHSLQQHRSRFAGGNPCGSRRRSH